jgi:hypothetical protein
MSQATAPLPPWTIAAHYWERAAQADELVASQHEREGSLLLQIAELQPSADESSAAANVRTARRRYAQALLERGAELRQIAERKAQRAARIRERRTPSPH